ncbi:MAG: hypothetical protein QOG04_323 [Actinomycetota bacterium]|jgi:DNA-binding response OmpR family regulator|nr:hypothetical protein [Actinomycetota bacterium]
MARILVVDDDTQVRKLVARVLTDDGHAVLAVGDGQQGISYFFAMKPDIMILDLAMPGTDGFSVLRCVREDAIKAGSRIIILSAGTESRIVRSYELGADHYICKPFVIEEISEGVAQALSLRSNQSRITSNL